MGMTSWEKNGRFLDMYVEGLRIATENNTQIYSHFKKKNPKIAYLKTVG